MFCILDASGTTVVATFARPQPDLPNVEEIDDTDPRAVAFLAGETPDMLLKYADSKQLGILAQVWSFDVGTSAAPLSVTTRLDSAGQAAMVQLLLVGQANLQVAGFTEAYSNVDYTGATLNAQQCVALALEAGQKKSASIAVLNEVAAGIAAGTITTRAQIDAAAWPTNA